MTHDELTPRGLNLKIKPKPMEKVVRGIIYPDTVTPPSQEWGVIEDANGLTNRGEKIKDGSRVLYMGKKCFELSGEKIVNKLKLLYWV